MPNPVVLPLEKGETIVEPIPFDSIAYFVRHQIGFTEPMPMPKWLPPNGFTGKVHHMDAKVGGTLNVIFQLHDGQEPLVWRAVSGTRASRTPSLHGQLRRSEGEIRVTVTLKKVSCGTEVNIVQEGVPDVIPAEACYLGWQESLIIFLETRRCGDPGLGHQRSWACSHCSSRA